MHVPLTAHLLRFTLRAETDIHFHEYRGSALRGALAAALRRHYCPEWHEGSPDPLHRQLCPVCQLLSWEHDDVEAGAVRRPYSLVTTPDDDRTIVAAGDEFTFGLGLFGNRLALFPYLVLGVTAMGDAGIGRRAREGMGHFRLAALAAVNPLTGVTESLFTAGDATVRHPTLCVRNADVQAVAAALAAQLRDGRLTLRALTPLRLDQDQRLVKSATFFPFVKQVVLRVMDLAAQHGDGRPPVSLRQDLYPVADRVTLVEDRMRWWDLAGYSSRLGRAQRLGGLVGEATYHAPDWRPLLPWLVWGQIVQVGKHTVKGCGQYALAAG
jgi:hypothetical protein